MTNTPDFKAEREQFHREKDALDRLRVETELHLRKYARRIRDDGVRYVKARLSLEPNLDPDELGIEAARLSSQGMVQAGRGVPELEASYPAQ